ncbi:unnamed protein product [Chrysoparadoxa australica]
MQIATPILFVTNTMCPYAQRTYICLEELKLPYKMDEISLYGPGGKPEYFLQMNPKGEVPVLKRGDEVVVGSEATLDYLASLSGELKPAEPHQSLHSQYADKMQRWRDIVNNELNSEGKRVVLGGGSSKKLDAVLHKLDSELEVQEASYVCGNEVSISDISAFPFLWRLNQDRGLPDDCPRLKGWLKAMEERPAVAKTLVRSWWWWW